MINLSGRTGVRVYNSRVIGNLVELHAYPSLMDMKVRKGEGWQRVDVSYPESIVWVDLDWKAITVVSGYSVQQARVESIETIFELVSEFGGNVDSIKVA